MKNEYRKNIIHDTLTIPRRTKRETLMPRAYHEAHSKKKIIIKERKKENKIK